MVPTLPSYGEGLGVGPNKNPAPCGKRDLFILSIF